MAHAKLSPSGAFRWSSCTAAPGQEAGKPDSNSTASMQGTAEHQISAECLEQGLEPALYLGKTMLFWSHAMAGTSGEMWQDDTARQTLSDNGAVIEHEITIDDESVNRCVAYVNFVRDLVKAHNAALMVEQRVPIEQITGEVGAKGTSDAVLFAGEELIIADAKFGQGRVRAYEVVTEATETTPAVLEPNKQLAMYAHGALTEFGWMGDFKTVRMIIVQPKLNAVSEFAMSVEALETFVQGLREAAEATRSNPVFVPNADNCFFCKGRFDCAARNAAALSAATDAFRDADEANPLFATPETPDTTLGTTYAKLPFIKKWMADIEQLVADRLAAGKPVVRADGQAYKLVEGREGNREWSDPAAAEAALKKMRLKPEQMYDFKLISPTKAEALTKPKTVLGEVVEPPLGPRRWNKLVALITRKPGSPTVALDTDRRPSVSSTTAGFESQQTPPPVDLFS